MNRPSDVDIIVNEIFGPTLQGEGPSIGRPCVFLRLATCNLNCTWCDTPYTWAFSDRKAALHESGVKYYKVDEVHPMLVDDAIDILHDKLYEIPAGLYEHRLIVVSGGEPMLQQRPLTRLIRNMGSLYDWEIETAGTRRILPELAAQHNVSFNVSPKLAHSGNTDAQRYVPDALRSFVDYPRAVFKFVVGDVAQLDEIQFDFVEAFSIPPSRVYIMPLGTVDEEVLVNMQNLAEAVIKRGWNLTTRMHTLIWGMERGR